VFFFFFSSRRRHTRFSRDWSSDVCSSDLYLPETLATVAEQKYREWELIVVEDASTGRTEAIVGQFAAAHPDRRVLYLRHETNQEIGRASCRERGEIRVGAV